MGGYKESHFLPNHCHKCELSIEDWCVLWDNRAAVPLTGKTKAIDTLHKGHPGMV